MSWAFPWLLAALAALPALWFLLRALPPAPRVQSFPALRLLAGLAPPRETVARASPWLLLLRIVAFALLVVGLAGPLRQHHDRPDAAFERGDVAIVVDNGWAAAADWNARQLAARRAIDAIDRAGHRGWLIADADPGPDTAETALPAAALPAAALRGALTALRPQAWAPDRAALARRLDRLPASADVLYLADGVATAHDDALAAALHRFAHVAVLRDTAASPLLLGRPHAQADRLDVPLLRLPGASSAVTLSAQDADGNMLASATGSTGVAFDLPAELRNRIARLTVPGVGAGGVRLLDEAGRRRPVGLLGHDSDDTPLLGRTYYLRRALADGSELREGDLPVLLGRQLSVIIAPDGTVDSLSSADRRRLRDWVQGGGMLVRFAGPQLADPGGAAETADDGATQPATRTDPLLPVPLLAGTRQLGGAMSWDNAQGLAPWPPGSPFDGLPVSKDVAVRRQVLAAPSGTLAQSSWARLADGTPLVTHHPLGHGQLVLFHVTSNADWSDLPLSGLFVDMLHRLIERSAGFAPTGDDQTPLAPVLALDGSGALTIPPPGAQGLAAGAFGTTPASAQHPPGLYGPLSERRALNLADTLTALAPQALAGGRFGRVFPLTAERSAESFGPILAAIGLGLLAIDQIAVLALRGGLGRPRRRRTAAIAALLLAALVAPGAQAQAQAQVQTQTPPAADSPPQSAPELPQGALHTTLAYIRTGDAQRDEMLREGLAGLAAYTTARTSATVAPPVGVSPGQDDLAYYPVIYWAVGEDPLDPKAIAALNAYLAHGGMLLIDSHAGDTALGPDALRHATEGLDIPPLVRLDDHHVLAHTFYLLHDFPGRWSDAPVWVASASQSGTDGIVSPVVIGAGGWAAAWAVDAQGQTPYAAIPGGEDQRRTAYRFGVNLLIYALTGTYKADQTRVPALLERLGQ